MLILLSSIDSTHLTKYWKCFIKILTFVCATFHSICNDFFKDLWIIGFDNQMIISTLNNKMFSIFILDSSVTFFKILNIIITYNSINSEISCWLLLWKMFIIVITYIQSISDIFWWLLFWKMFIIIFTCNSHLIIFIVIQFFIFCFWDEKI
jgi:hypothetical protein